MRCEYIEQISIYFNKKVDVVWNYNNKYVIKYKNKLSVLIEFKFKYKMTMSILRYTDIIKHHYFLIVHQL